MYDGRCTTRTTEAPSGAYVRCTTYDVRLGKFGERSSRSCEALAKVVREIMWRCWFERFANHAKPGREAGADRAEALGRAYVRGTMYEVNYNFEAG